VRLARRSRILRVGGLLALVALCAASAGTPAGGQGLVGIEKSVAGLSDPPTPGAGFSYRLTAGCSSLTVACVGATVTDVLPPALIVIPLQSTARDRIGAVARQSQPLRDLERRV
jgi:hypothetical protein